MSGLCEDCEHYEPFSVYWESVKWGWIDDETPGGEAAGLADFDESARYHVHEQWKTRRWGRCLFAQTAGCSLRCPESKAGAIDPDDHYYAELRCAPDFGCVQFSERAEKEDV